MNEVEARELLASRVDQLRLIPYRELLKLLGKPQSTEVAHSSGRPYQIEVEAFWDDKPRGNLRVRVNIDDGGWRAFHPLMSDFIRAPDDQFVGEP